MAGQLASGKTVHEGPQGGSYTITAAGNKAYVQAGAVLQASAPGSFSRCYYFCMYCIQRHVHHPP